MENRSQPHSESYLMCKNMMDSVFRESKNKFMDYKIERIKNSLSELNPNVQNIQNKVTSSTQTTIKTFYKSTKSLANGSGYSAAKFLK